MNKLFISKQKSMVALGMNSLGQNLSKPFMIIPKLCLFVSKAIY